MLIIIINSTEEITVIVLLVGKMPTKSIFGKLNKWSTLATFVPSTSTKKIVPVHQAKTTASLI